MSKTTIKDHFEKYYLINLQAVSVTRDSIQFQETRRAFYAAWFACLAMLRDGVGDESTSEAEGVKILEEQWNEAEEFGEQIKRGEA